MIWKYFSRFQVCLSDSVLLSFSPMPQMICIILSPWSLYNICCYLTASPSLSIQTHGSQQGQWYCLFTCQSKLRGENDISLTKPCVRHSVTKTHANMLTCMAVNCTDRKKAASPGFLILGVCSDSCFLCFAVSAQGPMTQPGAKVRELQTLDCFKLGFCLEGHYIQYDAIALACVKQKK